MNLLPLLNHSQILLISYDHPAACGHIGVLCPQYKQPQQTAPLVKFPSVTASCVFLAEITPNSPDRLVLCPGVSAAFTLISPVTHPFHATDRDSLSVSLHITFAPASCRGDFLGGKNLEMLSCCPSPLAVVSVDASGLRQWPARSMALKNHHSSANWEQQESWPCSRRRAGFVLPRSAPLKPLVTETQSLQQQSSTVKLGMRPPRLDLIVGYSSWRTWALFFLDLTLWLCNALQADQDVHPFIINNWSHHVKIQKHPEADEEQRQLCC